jgi:hypothetical protein
MTGDFTDRGARARGRPWPGAWRGPVRCLDSTTPSHYNHNIPGVATFAHSPPRPLSPGLSPEQRVKICAHGIGDTLALPREASIRLFGSGADRTGDGSDV